MEKYRKLIESIRLYSMIALGFAMAISGNLIVCLSIALILGFVDQIQCGFKAYSFETPSFSYGDTHSKQVQKVIDKWVQY
ncbi:hypothetical protein [Neobacillus drentensis]|uniref:hypothetical protein n=1 Tax=Neobacillus drentensis TaxID=220684 RepID=UPI0008253D6A|nr:hypothetical protein [Neobacillus drentensis]